MMTFRVQSISKPAHSQCRFKNAIKKNENARVMLIKFQAIDDIFFFFVKLYLSGGGGHSNGKRGYQARPWIHKKHPNHIFFIYEKQP